MKIKAYEITFKGTIIGGIGRLFKLRAERFGRNPKEAIKALYDRFDLIRLPQAKEIKSPFDPSALAYYIENNKASFERIEFLARLFVEAVEKYADEQDRAQKAWHNDPASPDHGLYHAPRELKYPPASILTAAAVLFLERLKNYPEAEEVELLREGKEQGQ